MKTKTIKDPFIGVIQFSKLVTVSTNKYCGGTALDSVRYYKGHFIEDDEMFYREDHLKARILLRDVNGDYYLERNYNSPRAVACKTEELEYKMKRIEYIDSLEEDNLDNKGYTKFVFRKSLDNKFRNDIFSDPMTGIDGKVNKMFENEDMFKLMLFANAMKDKQTAKNITKTTIAINNGGSISEFAEKAIDADCDPVKMFPTISLFNCSGETFYGVSIGSEQPFAIQSISIDFNKTYVKDYVFTNEQLIAQHILKSSIDNYKEKLFIIKSNHQDSPEIVVYNRPTTNNPTVLREMGIVVFSSKEEIQLLSNKAGNYSNLATTHLLGIDDIEKGYSNTIFNLSDSEYWTIDRNKVYKIPNIYGEERIRFLEKYGLRNDPRLLTKNLLIVKNNCADKSRDGIIDINSDVFCVWCRKIDRTDVPLYPNMNIWLFNNKSTAESYAANYGSLFDYINAIAAKQRNEEVEKAKIEIANNLNSQHYENNKQLVNILFRGIGISAAGAATLGAKEAILYLYEKYKETQKTGACVKSCCNTITNIYKKTEMVKEVVNGTNSAFNTFNRLRKAYEAYKQASNITKGVKIVKSASILSSIIKACSFL